MTCEMRHGLHRHFITTGTYKVSDPHADEWGFKHGGVGTPCVILYPKRRKIVPYMALEDAVLHLERG